VRRSFAPGLHSCVRARARTDVSALASGRDDGYYVATGADHNVSYQPAGNRLPGAV